MLFRLLSLTRFPTVLIILLVLLFGFICVGIANHAPMHGTSMNSSGMMMSGVNQQECCNANFSKNTDSWKNIILTVPDKMRDTLALLMLGLVLILGYIWISPWNRRSIIDLDVGRLRLYEKDNPELILFNHLKLAFARGILNPKIY